MRYFITLLFIFSFTLNAKLKVQRVNSLSDKEWAVEDYLVSEKLDGIRAIWDGKRLWTRNHNPIYAPAFFTKNWPASRLDGELYIGRAQFELVLATVMDTRPNHQAWQKVRFHVFDMPSAAPFFKRAQSYQTLIEQQQNTYLKAVTQHQFLDKSSFNTFYQKVIRNQGEGVILHLKSALFETDKSGSILKLKPHHDHQATVVQVLPGKGKYQGKMGALLVKDKRNKVFKVGTGFTDIMRENPPREGQTIIYRHNGYTKNDLPRFPRFIKLYQSP